MSESAKARGPFQQRLPHSPSGKLTERWRAERGLLWTIRRSLIELQTFHQQPHCITPATLQICNLCDRESKIQKFGFTIVLCSHNRHNRENPNLSNKIIRSSHSVIMWKSKTKLDKCLEEASVGEREREPACLWPSPCHVTSTSTYHRLPATHQLVYIWASTMTIGRHLDQNWQRGDNYWRACWRDRRPVWTRW